VGDADGEVVRLGDVLGLGDVVPVGEALGLPPPLPLQVTPLILNDVGTGLAPLQAPLKPVLVVAPVASAPLYDMLAAVTPVPDWV
jgi:hypothetical protein